MLMFSQFTNIFKIIFYLLDSLFSQPVSKGSNSGLEAVKDPVTAVVGDSPKHGQASYKDGVVVVSAVGLLAESDQRSESTERDEVVADGGHAA